MTLITAQRGEESHEHLLVPRHTNLSIFINMHTKIFLIESKILDGE